MVNASGLFNRFSCCYCHFVARTARVSPAILRLIARSAWHAWTLEDLQTGLASEGVSADFSSIFRAAEKLTAGGEVRKVVLDDGRARFELAGTHHDYLHCTACDELIAVPCVIEREACSALEGKIGIAIAEHQVVLSGLCPACRAARAA